MIVKRVIKKIVCHFPKGIFNFLISLANNKRFTKPTLSISFFGNDIGSSCIKEKPTRIKHEYELQIIVPCYNISKYGEKCIKSLVNQKTAYKYLIYLIDDGSEDDTLSILKKYESPNVVVLHKENGGSASARNLGLEHINAKYVMFVDSDDYLLNENAIENMLNVVNDIKECNKKLIVEFDYINSLKKIKAKKKYMLKKCSSEKLTGFPWGKIYSSELFKNICFPERYWFEDTLMHMIVYPMADACYKSNYCSYFYTLNDNGMTSLSLKSNKTIDTFYVTQKLLEDRKKLCLIKDSNFNSRFFYQTICNCNRLKVFPIEAQLVIFFETQKLLAANEIKDTRQFRTLYKSLSAGKFKQYVSFCKWFSALYLNVD